MKKIIFSTMIASLLAFVGCQNEELVNENTNNGGEKVILTANIQGAADSRVALTLGKDDDDNPIVKVAWNESGETFEVYGSSGAYSTFTQIAGTNLFEGTLPETANGEYEAYYGDPSSLDEQDGKLGQSTANDTPVLMSATFDSSSPSITFEHLTAILKPTFMVDDTDIDNSITKIVMGGVAKANSDNGYYADEITIAPTSPATVLDDNIYIHLLVFPQVYKDGHKFTFTVTAGSKEYIGSLTIPEDMSIVAGKLYTAEMNMTEYEPVICELPTGNFFNTALNNTTNFANATSIIFDAKSTRTGGMQIGETQAYTIVEGNILYVYTAADVFVFNQTSSNMFTELSRISEIVFGESINTSNVTSMSQMFIRCSSLASLDLSNFNTSNVTSMGDMFYGCSSLESLNLRNFNTSNVTSMGFMFNGCSSLESLDLSNFNTSNVTSMRYMFSGCSSLASLDLSNFNTSNVTSMSKMFYGCTRLTSLGLSNFDTSKVNDMSGMFEGCSSLASLDLRNFNTSNVTNMQYMFSGCSGLASLDLSNFNTSNVTSMTSMFNGCSSLTSLSLNLPSTFDASNVSSMKDMFKNCSGLTSINCVFKASKVSNTEYMFNGCSNLESLDLSDFRTTDEVKIYMTSMFDGCSKLASLKFSDRFCTNVVYGMGSMFKNCSSLTSLDLSNFNTSNVDNMSSMFEGCSGFTSLDLCSFTFINSDIYIRKDMFKNTLANLMVYVKDTEQQRRLRSLDSQNSSTGISNSDNIVVCETQHQ